MENVRGDRNAIEVRRYLIISIKVPQIPCPKLRFDVFGIFFSHVRMKSGGPVEMVVPSLSMWTVATASLLMP